MIVVNFKAYVFGKKALEIAKACEKVKEETGIDIIVCPSFLDLQKIIENVKIDVFAQHVDPIEKGAFTGHVPPEGLKEIGVKGTLLNHSEKRLRLDQINKSIELCKKLDLKVIVCANDPLEGKAVSVFEPLAVAIEPPELIGTGISVSKAKPEVIQKAVEIIKEINPKVKVLVGAGISGKDDVKKALELGAEGVLVSSYVVKADNPYERIKDLAEGFK